MKWKWQLLKIQKLIEAGASESPPASPSARRLPDQVESVVEGSQRAETKQQRI